MIEWKKYTYTFLITAVIFITAIFASNYFTQKRINEIKNIESRISVDILASETQFSLLSELSCKDIGNSFLSQELAELGDKLSYMENNRGTDDEEVINLKKYYSLLQIKDYLLMQKVNERCGAKTLFIMYFYSNKKNDCPDCQKEGFVLTRLREDYPELRVYSFDYNLELSALKTLINIYDIKDEQPTILVNDEVNYGFKSIDDIKEIIPVLKEIDKQREIEKTFQATTTTF
ncbi:MAG: hypothetical protein JW740_03035 [Candidatus Zambryskibacteria bacterium]|nr:hypothetical protein [Candidatus Zambryskibacteria bacterium]